MKKSDILLLTLVVFLVIFTISIPFLGGIAVIATPLFLWAFLLPAIILSALIVVPWALRGKRCMPQIACLVGGLYALVPALVYLWIGEGGDPGPVAVYLIPSNLPLFITFLASSVAINIIKPLIHYSKNSLAVSLLNICLWMVIGYCIGNVVNRKKNDR